MFTTTDLISSVKTRGMIPDASTGSWSDANILVLATEELHITIVPLIMAARERYYEKPFSQPLLTNVDTYDIPARATGGLISSLSYTYGLKIIQLASLDSTAPTSTQTSQFPRGFYFQNNSVVVYPVPTSSGAVLNMRYFQRPNRLATVADCAQITYIDTGTNTLTCSSIPASWSTNSIVDIIPSVLPYTPLAIDQAVASVGSGQISFASLPTGLAVGDWIALKDTTPIPELPNEFFPILCQATVVKMLEASGDKENLQAAQAKLQEYMQRVLKLITPRNQSALKKVCSSWRNW